MRYNIVPSLHFHQLVHKADVVQGFCLSKIASHMILGKILVGFFQRVEEINQCKGNTIPFPERNTQVKELEIK